jgi:Ca2+-binding EF-hand superfamily protein
VRTLGVGSGVNFDLYANGQDVQTGWVSASDGLLVLDRNADGSIGDGSELFGSSTVLANGQKANDGYQALREFDTNADGYISADDAVFNELRVWVDANSDGNSATGELKTLAELGISKISVQTQDSNQMDNGNWVGLTSSYETVDGATHAAADVWFKTLQTQQPVPTAMPSDAANAETAQTPLSAPVVQVNLSFPGAAEQTELAASTMPVQESPAQGLLGRVSGMASALGGMGQTTQTADGNAGLTNPLSETGSGTTAALAGVAAMADVMKRFDSNGNMLGQAGVATPTAAADLTKLSGLKDVQNNPILPSGR